LFDVIDVIGCHWQKGTLGENAECAEDGRFRCVERKLKLTILNSSATISGFTSNPIDEEE
jgi:hypothetical protein